jgi:multiple sugar transport system permease protein
MRRRDAPLGILLVAPLLLWLTATIAYPLLEAVRLSLTSVGIIGTTADFVGLRNFRTLLGSGEFWRALGRSGIWVVGNAGLQTLLAFAAALILNQQIRGIRGARTWLVLSWIVPTVVVVIIWRWMLSGSIGVVSYVLQALGIVGQPVSFFGTRRAAFVSLIVINAWRWFPFLAVIILAGLQTIPREQYEAAAVDGASAWQRFWYITLPLLQPILFVMGLLGTLWSVNVFDVIWLFTKGGPSAATTTLPVFIYERAFARFALGEAAAASVLTAMILLLFSVLYLRLLTPPTMREAEREV